MNFPQLRKGYNYKLERKRNVVVDLINVGFTEVVPTKKEKSLIDPFIVPSFAHAH